MLVRSTDGIYQYDIVKFGLEFGYVGYRSNYIIFFFSLSCFKLRKEFSGICDCVNFLILRTIYGIGSATQIHMLANRTMVSTLCANWCGNLPNRQVRTMISFGGQPA